MPGKLLGVYVCHYNKMFYPGDDQWEHAKLCFRCTVTTGITLKDHLHDLHWVKANGLCIAAREGTGPDSPLRRLLKPHYWNTATINFQSKVGGRG